MNKFQRTAYTKANVDVISAAGRLLVAKPTSGPFKRCENRK